ncbi:MAG: nitroreductase family protein [Pseudomonadota bacterium]
MMTYDEVARLVWAPIPPRSDTDIEYLIHYATLAANSHNTQPWLFSGSGREVSIRPDLNRATPSADADLHHLFASLGCATENLVLAAAAAGWRAETRFEEAGEGTVIVDFADDTRVRDPLFDAIVDRQNTRSEYDGRPVPPEDLKAMEMAADIDGCRVILISEKSRIEHLLELVIAANTVQVEDPAFVEELTSWVRFNRRDAVKMRDGLYSACAGNPSLPSWLGRLLFKFVFKAKTENEKYAKQIRSSAGLAVFVSDRDDRAHWVQAGRSYQRFALQATALGIRHAFINQPVEVAQIRSQVADWLGIGDQRPDLVLRYGYAPPMPRSLRRPVADVIV